MTYTHKSYNLLLDLGSNIYNTLPKIEMERLSDLKTKLTELMETETDSTIGVTIGIRLTGTKYTPHAYPLVTYKRDDLADEAKGLLEELKVKTNRTTGITVKNTNQASDLEVVLYPLRTLDDEQSLVLTMNKNPHIVRETIEHITSGKLASLAPNDLNKSHAPQEPVESIPQEETGSPSTLQSNETLELIEQIADSDGDEQEVADQSAHLADTLPPEPPELPNLFAYPAPNEIKGVI